MSIVTEKKCAKCGEIKPVSEFYKHKKTYDGLFGSCKECKKAYRRDSDNYSIDIKPRIKKPVYLACVDCGTPKSTRRARSRPYCHGCGKARNSGIFPVDGKITCSKCGETKPVSDFSTRKGSGRERYRGECRECEKVADRLWRANNLERARATARKHYYKHYDKERESARVKHQLLRAEILAAYGGKCACCGEATNEFLAIDHINGDGKIDRAINPNLYRTIKKKGFPPGYRVLCHNCNQALGHYGYCPHNNLENNSQPLWWREGKEKVQ